MAKENNSFKKVIENYLKKRAFQDPLFRITFAKENKNIDDCVTYILNTVKASGQQGFLDDEIFNMAIHYYDEDDIKPGSKVNNAQVVINQKVTLTADEIEAAKEEAKQQVMQEQCDKMLGAKKKETVKKQTCSELPENKDNLTLF